MNLEIVIPVYRALDYLKLLLADLDTHYPSRQLVLVDDCSGGATSQFLEHYSQKENTVLLKRTQRGWFTRATNTGLRYVLGKNGSCPEWVAIINSDCRISAGGFEELFDVWSLAEKENGKTVGLVGACGPRDRNHHMRYQLAQEPGYVTGHALLFSTKFMIEQNLLFPWKDGQVRGFKAKDLIHVNSDRALSYEMNRRGFLAVASFWGSIGHAGGKSWGYRLGDIPQPSQVGEE